MIVIPLLFHCFKPLSNVDVKCHITCRRCCFTCHTSFTCRTPACYLKAHSWGGIFAAVILSNLKKKKEGGVTKGLRYGGIAQSLCKKCYRGAQAVYAVHVYVIA